MSEKILQGRIMQKHGTVAEWAKATTFIPKDGELIVYDPAAAGEVTRFKVGNGVDMMVDNSNEFPIELTVENTAAILSEGYHKEAAVRALRMSKSAVPKVSQRRPSHRAASFHISKKEVIAMTIENFLAAIEEIKATNPQYKLGRDGDDGYCDCVGMVIGAARRCGEVWSGIHGTNWAVRHYTANLHAVNDDSDLSLGDLVYKTREPAEAYYDLPSRYANDPDQKDYYHIGVVTQVNPLRITHCTSSGLINGITVDKKRNGWEWVGELTLIDGVEQDEMKVEMTVATTATVTATSGSNVNMRKTPSKTGILVERVPVGTTVTVNSNNGKWAQIMYGGKTGYMMSEFLTEGDVSVDVGAGDVPRADEIRAQIVALVDELVGMAK